MSAVNRPGSELWLCLLTASCHSPPFLPSLPLFGDPATNRYILVSSRRSGLGPYSNPVHGKIQHQGSITGLASRTSLLFPELISALPSMSQCSHFPMKFTQQYTDIGGVCVCMHVCVFPIVLYYSVKLSSSLI